MTAIAKREAKAMPKSRMTACHRLHLAPISSFTVIFPLPRMPASAIAKQIQRKAVGTKQKCRKARVCRGLSGLISAYGERASPVEHEWKRKENSEKNTKVGTACNATTQAPIEINFRDVHLLHSILSFKRLRVGRKTRQYNPNEGLGTLDSG